MMLFGEKYPDIVRMVSMGDFSKELCGGTHLDNTGQVGLFKIVGEESVSAGTRRITALTGREALERICSKPKRRWPKRPRRCACPPAEVPAPRGGAGQGTARTEEATSPPAAQPAELSAEKLLAEATDVGDVTVVVAEAPGADADVMRQLIDQLRKKASPIAVLLGSREEDKVTLVAGISRDLEAARPQRRQVDSQRRPKWSAAAAAAARHGPGRRQASGKAARSARRSP